MPFHLNAMLSPLSISCNGLNPTLITLPATYGNNTSSVLGVNSFLLKIPTKFPCIYCTSTARVCPEVSIIVIASSVVFPCVAV